MLPLLMGLVDDAALFPPAGLPMAEALARHRSATSPLLSGHFLCPASRHGELLSVADPQDRLELHLIGPGVDLSHEDVRARVVAVEVRAGEQPAAPDVPVYVEDVSIRELAGSGRFGKLRCGGERIPEVDEVAAFIREASSYAVPFKATAGLHAAIRGWDRTDGIGHHGYLNVLLATARALSGGDVEGALWSEDSAAMAAEARSLPSQLAASTRQLFHSYGSCDIERPVEDAARLGLLG